MALSSPAVNGVQNTFSMVKSVRTTEVDSVGDNVIQALQNRFVDEGEYENKRDKLLDFLNSILGKAYSFSSDGLPIERIFDENSFTNNNKICNAGKKAYAYYLKEVLQKLNLLNQHILKGKEALNALQTCTDKAQIENYKTILEIQDGLVKKYLDDFNNYTVVQTLSTIRTTQRHTIAGEKFEKKEDSVEINYAIKGKIWGENGIGETNFKNALDALDSLDALRNLTTVKEIGFQSITTTLTNKHTGNITNLNDQFGFNVVQKTVNASPSDPSPIALFDELTLLEKLKYIHTYYKNNTNPYHYPSDFKSGVPCMSREELVKYVPDGNDDADDNNTNELRELGIIPSAENAPKADLVEPGALELFYIGYLKDSMGTINALAAFMEIKSVSLMAQITQQSYRIKALKAYLSMLEFGLKALNESYNNDEAISPKAYLAIKYAAANQTRTLVNINGEDYIVMQVDETKTQEEIKQLTEEGKPCYWLSNNNAYIYVKATEAGINEFLGLEYTLVDAMFDSRKDFKDLSDSEIIAGCDAGTKFYSGVNFEGKVANYDYLHEIAKKSGWYTITTDGKLYYNGVNEYVHVSNGAIKESIKFKSIDNNNETERMIKRPELQKSYWIPLLTWLPHDHLYYKKNTFSSDSESINPDHILFAKFDSDDEAKKYLPKELETVKVKMNELLKTNVGNTGTNISWNNRALGDDNKYKSTWASLVEMWQNVCQTAIENIGSQIESVNKTIKSLRSKIDTFDSSANRFRDKFYSTTMTVLNKLS